MSKPVEARDDRVRRGRLTLAILLTIALACMVVLLWHGADPSVGLGSESGLPRERLVLPTESERSPVDRQHVSTTGLAADPIGKSGLSVHASWADGRPAAGVTLSLEVWEESGGLLARRTTDDLGDVDFGDVPTGAYLVTGDRGGQEYVKHRNGGLTKVTIVFAHGLTVTGRVADGSGVGIAEATIYLDGTEVAAATALTRSDSLGEFTVSGLRDGCEIWASASGRAPSRKFRVSANSRMATLVTLVLPGPGSSMLVTAVDVDGALVVGGWAYVSTVAPSAGDRYSRLMFMGAEGALFEGLPLEGVVIAAGAAGYAATLARLDLESEDIVKQQMVLTKGATIVGTVLSTGGAPVANASVTQGHGPFGRTARVDREGRYLLRHVSVGNVTVEAKGGVGQATKQVIVADGEECTVDFVMSDGLALVGRCVYEDRMPAVGVRLALRAAVGGNALGRETLTDKSGGFRFDQCSPGEHLLEIFPVESALFPARVDRVVAGPTPLVLRVPNGMQTGAVAGAVVDENRPTPKAIVSVVPFGSGSDAAFVSTEADEAGRFLMQPLLAGRYEVIVATPEVGRFVAGDFTLLNGQKLDIGRLHVPRMGVCEVAMDGLADDVYAKVYLVAGSLSHELIRNGPIFSSDRVPAGEYMISTYGDVPVVDESVSVVGGATKKVKISKVGTSVVDFRFICEASEGARSYQVEVRGGRMGSLLRLLRWKQAAEPMAYQSLMLPPGAYDILVFTSSGESGRSTILVGSSPSQQDIQLR